ncbi:SGNH/GDSL hydrolase family protein [Oscillatoria acuminata]|uniref:PEP-CTERM putative exosortase interaction domain-containing protein n=1 Tax=Oscillatoria acuminata PCC 6304 TaxID=56110 RepID=K9TJY5_9CYAN|nr:SGNH/GDSL hydrolase family protein [Oscillatoria acuminata]AFY83177.1 PEP-CTERM putative exosortase interaction domain-containing protein [Oscillatoria acuminata PCC 6304]
MKKMNLTLTSAGFATLLLLGATSSPVQAFSLTQSNPLKIMPLGDSNTRGHGNDPAGYRDDLWMLLNESEFNVDFVGSEIRNPPSNWDQPYAFDRNHQGHGGYAISGSPHDWAGDLMDNIDNWLNAATPDVILLMAGTNDFLHQDTTAQEKIDELGILIDKIFAWSSDVNLLVSSIAPLAPNRGLAQEVTLYNDLMPGLLGSDRYQQNNLSFVDTRHLFTLDDLHDGIHFTPQGYTTLAHAWFDGIVSASDLAQPPTDPIVVETPGSGDLVSIPEPTSVLGVLAFGLVGAGSLRKRRHVSCLSSR